MRKLALVAAATASMLLLAGAPAYATDLPDVPISVGVPTAVSDAADTGYSFECEGKSSLGPNDSRPWQSSYCVVHWPDNYVQGTLDFRSAVDGVQQVFYDLEVYRCRTSDNVCVLLEEKAGSDYTDASGYWSVTTDGTFQTWSGRYYKACAALSTVNYGFPKDCTLKLYP